MDNTNDSSKKYKNESRGAWARIESDKQTRRTKRVRHPDLFQYRAEAPVNLSPIGTALVLFAPENNEQLKDIRKSLQKGDTASLVRIEAELAAYFGANEPSLVNTPLEAAELLIEESVYAELRYESKVVVPIMAASKRKPLGGIVIPYIGGPLFPDGFTYEEYCSNSKALGLSVIVIAKEPNLSPLERTMLGKVAATEMGMILGSGGYGIWPAAVVWVVLVTLTGTACLVGNEAMAAIRLDEDELFKVDPSANALKLLRLREQILLHHT